MTGNPPSTVTHETFNSTSNGPVSSSHCTLPSANAQTHTAHAKRPSPHYPVLLTPHPSIHPFPTNINNRNQNPPPPRRPGTARSVPGARASISAVEPTLLLASRLEQAELEGKCFERYAPAIASFEQSRPRTDGRTDADDNDFPLSAPVMGICAGFE